MKPAIADLLTRVFERTGPSGLVVAWLFGSHAEGRAHRESDVDVAVVLDYAVFPDARSRFDERVRLTSWLIGELHINLVDVVVLNDSPPTLGRRVVATGQRVYCANPEAAHAFERDVQLRAADIEPFLRRMRQIKRNALTRS
jgi:hypothetical protein